MYLKTKINLPFNIELLPDSLVQQFRDSLPIKKPKIKYLNNVFVSHEGIVLRKGAVVKGCAFNIKKSDDFSFYFAHWRKAIEQYLVCRFGNSLVSVQLKRPTKYLLIHSTWFNYGFWINGFLPRLVMAEKEKDFKQFVLLVPEHWTRVAYVQESLKLFDIQHKVIPAGAHMFVDELIMPECREFTAAFYPPLMQKTRARLLRDITNFEKFPSKIYVTRSKRGVRTVENENELIQLLVQKGFAIINFEDHSFKNQCTMMSKVKVFVSIHGAGFSNCIFMPKGSHAIELIGKEFAHYYNPFPHMNLCSAVQVKYGVVLSDKNKSKIKLVRGKRKINRIKLVNQNLTIDLEQLQDTLDLI